MPKAINMTEFSVNCDDCGYKEAAQPEQLRDYLDKPCPKCGAIMITEDDVKRMDALIEVINTVNNIVGDVPESDDTEEMCVAIKSENGDLDIHVSSEKN